MKSASLIKKKSVRKGVRSKSLSITDLGSYSRWKYYWWTIYD